MLRLKFALTSAAVAAFMLCAPVTHAAAAWHQVGDAGFTAGTADYTSLAVDSANHPYVAYRDAANGGKASVMEFDGDSWTQVGDAGFTAGAADYTSLAIDSSDNLYVAYRDAANGGKASVMKFDGDSWAQVGDAGFTPGAVTYVSLAIASDDTLSVGYRDAANSSKASVMTFDGDSWVQLGAAGFSAGAASYTSLMYDGTDPYIAYRDGANGGKATVMEFTGEGWVLVGDPGFTAGTADYVSLAIDNATPYVAYSDSANGDGASVMKYDGENWVQVGSAGFSASTAAYTSLMFTSDDTPYVAYQDAAHGDKATVMGFNGASWVGVGVAGFTPNTVLYTSLSRKSNDVLLIAYRDAANDGKASVMKFPVYAVSYSAGANGSISGDDTQYVEAGEDATSVSAMPDPGYHFVEWSDASTDNPRTDTEVSDDISQTATFAINEYTLTYNAGAHGSVTGTSPQTVADGLDGDAVTAVPDPGYHFVQWSDASTDNPRTDTDISGDITVTASFAINTWTITATAGSGGSIDPSGAVIVNDGDDQTFNFDPDLNRLVHDVKVDGVSVGRPSSYQFTDVTEDHTIAVTFAVRASGGGGGGGGEPPPIVPPPDVPPVVPPVTPPPAPPENPGPPTPPVTPPVAPPVAPPVVTPPPAPAVCVPYLTKYIKLGAANDPVEVKKLQRFLRDYEGFSDIKETGVYSQADFDAVRVFQSRYGQDILVQAWGITAPTGYVYRSTLKKINEIVCAKAAVEPAPVTPPPAPAVCVPYLTKYIKLGAANDPVEVKKLQRFLRDYEGFTDIKETGVYTQADFDAVQVFQSRYADDILVHAWGITAPTGYVYRSTLKKINEIVCAKAAH